MSDGGVFRNCDFYGALVCNELNLPLPTEVPPLNPGWNSTEPLPFVFVGDDAFPLTDFCMKPYHLTELTEEERLFNFRLSHFRRISENIFGIWSNRFRLFSTRICMQPEKATSCALASIAYTMFYVQNQETQILRQGLLMRQTKMERYMKANGGSKYTHLTIYCHSLRLIHEEVLLML